MVGSKAEHMEERYNTSCHYIVLLQLKEQKSVG